MAALVSISRGPLPNYSLLKRPPFAHLFINRAGLPEEIRLASYREARNFCFPDGGNAFLMVSGRRLELGGIL